MVDTLEKQGNTKEQAANDITILQLLAEFKRQKNILAQAQRGWNQRKQNPNYNQTSVAKVLEELNIKIKNLDSRIQEFEVSTPSQNQATTPSLEKKSEPSPEGKLFMELAKLVVTNMLQAQFPILNIFSLIGLTQQQLEIIDQLDMAKTGADYAKEKANPSVLFDKATKFVQYLSNEGAFEIEIKTDGSLQSQVLRINENRLRQVCPTSRDFEIAKSLLDPKKLESTNLDLLRLKYPLWSNNIVKFSANKDQK